MSVSGGSFIVPRGTPPSSISAWMVPSLCDEARLGAIDRIRRLENVLNLVEWTHLCVLNSSEVKFRGGEEDEEEENGTCKVAREGWKSCFAAAMATAL